MNKFFLIFGNLIAIYLMYHLFGKGEFELAAILCGTWLTSLVALYMHDKTREQEHKNWLLRDEKAYVADLIDFFTSLAHQDKKIVTNQQIKERVLRLQPAILAHGKVNTIRAWNELISFDSSHENHSDADIFRRIEGLIRALRKDLGHDDSEIDPGEIISIIIKPDERQKAVEVFKNKNSAV